MERRGSARSPRGNQVSKDVFYELNGIRMPHDDDIITPQVSAALKRGNYERPEQEAAARFLEPEDRVLELGAGIGYISTYIARDIGVAHITCVEANPKLVAYIQRVHALNGLKRITVRNCIALPGCAESCPGNQADFFLREPFWSSSLDPDRDYLSRVSVPQVPLSELIEDSGATAMIVDIEGGERDLFKGGDMGTVQKIYVELHTRYVRARGIKSCFDALSEHGFYYDQRVSHGGVVLFRKL